MISHANNFLFIHIPKTGGTSIERALGAYGKVLQGPENFDSIYFKHVTARDLRRMLGPSEYASYFRFAFVRNPWDWIVSNYSFARGLTRPFVVGTPYGISGRVQPEHRDWPFPDWLAWWIEELSPSQSSMVTDEEGELLVDFVGRFERLDADFRQICATLDLPAASLPHLKASQRDPCGSYYDPASRELVREHFRDDFELFGYSLEVPGHDDPTAAEGVDGTLRIP